MTSDSPAPGSGPAVECHQHCAAPGIQAEQLQAWAVQALPGCLAEAGDAEPPLLPGLELVEVSLISDAAIAAVHAEFLGDPEPTDVITFHHGEILISAETALRRASVEGHPPAREALLYLIHGLLHLNGHDDRSEPFCGLMHAAQERVLNAVWPLPEEENREY